jgi:hypothetical protein
MRFRKRLNILPGLYVNLSKSGASLSFGGKGLTYNIGSKGQYVTYGIPGTGLYDRKRIDTANTDSAANQNQILHSKLTITAGINIDADGKITINDEQGNPVTDEKLLRTIKKSAEYKNAYFKLQKMCKEEIDAKTNQFIGIYKSTPPLKSRSEWQSEIANLRIEEYAEKEFPELIPTQESTKLKLQTYAEKKIETFFSWTKKRKVEQYINENLNSVLENDLREWKKRKIEFETEEKNIKLRTDKELKNLYENKVSNLKKALDGDHRYVSDSISHIIGSLSLPLEFSMEYEFTDSRDLFIDLDLPEIDHIPRKKAEILSSGKVSVKDKTSKELNEDYVKCVLGLAFFFSGTFFNVSPQIKKMCISGYTQRISKRTGNMGDAYVFSIKFDRILFQDLNVKNIEPMEAMNNFVNRVDIITNKYEMKEIEPFKTDEA